MKDIKAPLKKAHDFARSKGYASEVTFLKMWRFAYVFSIKQPADEDFGEPLVIVVEKNGECAVRQLSDVL